MTTRDPGRQYLKARGVAKDHALNNGIRSWRASNGNRREAPLLVGFVDEMQIAKPQTGA